MKAQGKTLTVEQLLPVQVRGRPLADLEPALVAFPDDPGLNGALADVFKRAPADTAATDALTTE